MKKLLFIIFISLNSLIRINAQSVKHIYFDYALDSLRSRQTQISIPSQGQTAGISNSIITDYIANTRISISSSIIASRKDTFLAIHSLFNGIGNLSGDIESPILCKSFHPQNKGFMGISFNPRICTLINTGNMFEKSSISFDAGFNMTCKLQGEFGNLSAKIIFRNALTIGNYQFIKKIYNFNSMVFFYNTAQLRIKAQNNVFVINIPIILIPINEKEISGFPMYAGIGFNF